MDLIPVGLWQRMKLIEPTNIVGTERHNIKLFNLKNIIIIGVALIVIVGGAVLIFNPTRKEGQVRLTIKTVPDDATIYINNQKYSMPFSKYLDKGKYQVRVERFGFAVKNQEIDLNQDSIEAFGLTPVSQDAQNWANNNPLKYSEFEAIAGGKAQEEAAQAGLDNPILIKLPIIKSAYQIGTQSGPKEEIIITVHSPYSTQFLAIKDLLATRLDLAGYGIKYIDDSDPTFETNPFKRLTGVAL